jgi:hypothetical protein
MTMLRVYYFRFIIDRHHPIHSPPPASRVIACPLYHKVAPRDRVEAINKQSLKHRDDLFSYPPLVSLAQKRPNHPNRCRSVEVETLRSAGQDTGTDFRGKHPRV